MPANPKPLAANLSRGGTSLHRQVYLVLRDRLLAGSFAAGAQLPTEPELCEQFGVSRITLRRAVADLVEEGLLERVQGRGTFVTARAATQQPAGTRGYVEETRALSSDTTLRVLEFENLPAPGWVAGRLRLLPGEPVQRSVRLRLRHGVPVVQLTTWVPRRWSETITRAELARRPMHELLTERGVRFGRVLQEIGAGLADPLQAQRLEVGVGAPLLTIDRVVHDAAGMPVEYVCIVLTPERSRFVIDTPAELVEQAGSGRFVHADTRPARRAARRA
jgi:GntR family transcriptional regulator